MKMHNVNLDLSLSELVDIECLIEFALPKLHKEINKHEDSEEIAHFAGMYSAGHRLLIELHDNRTNADTNQGPTQ